MNDIILFILLVYVAGVPAAFTAGLVEGSVRYYKKRKKILFYGILKGLGSWFYLGYRYK